MAVFFDIFLGTREGGAESPILFSLFVFDRVQTLSTVELVSSPLLFGGGGGGGGGGYQFAVHFDRKEK